LYSVRRRSGGAGEGGRERGIYVLAARAMIKSQYYYRDLHRLPTVCMRRGEIVSRRRWKPVYTVRPERRGEPREMERAGCERAHGYNHEASWWRDTNASHRDPALYRNGARLPFRVSFSAFPWCVHYRTVRSTEPEEDSQFKALNARLLWRYIAVVFCISCRALARILANHDGSMDTVWSGRKGVNFFFFFRRRFSCHLEDNRFFRRMYESCALKLRVIIFYFTTVYIA